MPFEKVTTIPFRIICALWGREKEGKTHTALTFPKPLYYLGLDAGSLEGVIQKFPDEEIYVSHIKTGLLNGISAEQTLAQFEQDYGEALREASKRSGTVVVDTYTQIRQLIDNAKLNEVRARRAKSSNKSEEDVKVFPFDYAEANVRTGDYINQAWNLPNVNLVLIHRAAKVYDNGGNEIPGQFKMQGWGEVPAYAGVTIRMEQDQTDKKFHATIESCRSNPKLRGFRFPDPDYATLRSLLGGE